MTSLRSAHFPPEHVIAELAAFPLASVAALQCVAVALDPTHRKDDLRTHLWREAERVIISSSPSFSVDELTALRDALWFGGRAEQRSQPLSRYVRRLAADTLEPRGDVLVPRVPKWSARPAAGARNGADDQNAAARRAFRWLSFAMPADLLIAAHPRGGASARVELVSPSLARQLRDAGHSESHLHFKGAFDFALLWISAMHSIADLSLDHSYESPGAALREGRDLAAWLIRALIARMVLASFLTRNGVGGRPLPLHEALVDMGLSGAEPAESRAGRSTLDGSTVRIVRAALSDLLHGTMADTGPSFTAMRSAFARLSRIRSRWPTFPRQLDEAYAADPIGDSFPSLGPGRRTSEIAFTTAAMAHMEACPDDRSFSALFWQLTRVRGLFYRHMVQRPLTPGLQWFTRFYARMSPARRPMSVPLLVRSAAWLSGRESGLRSLEIRTSPEPTYNEMYKLVAEVAQTCAQLAERQATSSSPPVEYGLVLHLSRERGGQASKGLPNANAMGSFADPSFKENRGVRYARFYRIRRREALALGWLLSRYPQSLSIVRGIDVCTDELAIPTWVIAPLYRYLRDMGQLAADRLAERGQSVPRLRATAHAGEDFVHLLGGLRRIDEAVELLRLCDEDRLGHGIALGVDAARWARSAGGLVLSREERLFDLAWEWSFYHDRGLDASGGRVRFLMERISELTEESFGVALSPHQILALVRLLNDEGSLRAAGFPDRRRWVDEDAHVDPRSTAPSDLLHQYLTEKKLFEQLQTTVVEDPASEVEALLALQAELRRKVGARGITVELNPSSNLLVGNLGDLEHHPLWRLKPPRRSEEAPLDVCIGTDNPLTAVTRTPEEYQLAYDTLILAGASHAEAFAWIDDVRRTGLAHRFTLSEPLRPIGEVHADGHDDILRMP